MAQSELERLAKEIRQLKKTFEDSVVKGDLVSAGQAAERSEELSRALLQQAISKGDMFYVVQLESNLIGEMSVDYLLAIAKSSGETNKQRITELIRNAQPKRTGTAQILELAGNAVARGRYLFARQAYLRAESLADVIQSHIRKGTEFLGSSDPTNAAKSYLIASHLAEADLTLFQDKGPNVHKECEREGGTLCCDLDLSGTTNKIFEYLLSGKSIVDALKKEPQQLKEDLLKAIIKEQDPKFPEFLKRFLSVVDTITEREQCAHLIKELQQTGSQITSIPRHDFSLGEIEVYQDSADKVDFLIRTAGFATLGLKEINDKIGQVLKGKGSPQYDSLLEKRKKLYEESDRKRFDQVQSAVRVKMASEKGDEAKTTKDMLKLMAEKPDRIPKDMKSASQVVTAVIRVTKKRDSGVPLDEQALSLLEEFGGPIEETYVPEVSKVLFESLTKYLEETVKAKRALLSDVLRDTYKDCQRLLLGRATPTDAHWQYLRELTAEHPIAAFLVCVMPSSFLKHRQFSDDVAGTMKEFLKDEKMVLPVIRQDGKTLVESLDLKALDTDVREKEALQSSGKS
jgi:hypothetical protein